MSIPFMLGLTQHWIIVGVQSGEVESGEALIHIHDPGKKMSTEQTDSQLLSEVHAQEKIPLL